MSCRAPRRPPRLLLPLLLLLGACADGVLRDDAPARRAPDDDLLALLPAGAEAVLDLETATLRTLPSANQLQAELPEGARALSPDPLRDLDAVAVAVRGLGTPQVEAVVVARGRPSWSRLSAWLLAQQPDAREVDYHGVPILEGAQGRAAAMLTPRTAVLGGRTAVRQAVDNLRGETRGLRGQSDLTAALRRAPRAKEGRPAVLAALQPPGPLRERLREADLGELGADADYVALALAAGDGIDVGVVAGFRELAQARDVAGRIRDRVKALRARAVVKVLGLDAYLEPLVAVGAMAGPRRSDPEVHLAYRLSGEDLTGLVGKIEQIRALRDAARPGRAAPAPGPSAPAGASAAPR